MFFSKKGPSKAPSGPAAERTAPGEVDRRQTYRTVVNYLHSKDYAFDENADEFRIFFPTGLDTGHYTLLCSLANANLVNGTFYPSSDGEHIMVEVTQRVFSDEEFGEKTVSYLLGVMGGNLDSRYMKSMESICKGYTTLADELEKLSGED